MKLPIPKLSLQDSMSEFDIWITPSLGDVRDTERFSDELARISKVFDLMGQATNGFERMEDLDSNKIASVYLSLVEDKKDAGKLLHDLASTLFLVTGKSDNNAKCQLPLHLRDGARMDSYPSIVRGSIKEGPIPRELKSDKLMKSVGSKQLPRSKRENLLGSFISYVLSDDKYARQLWSLGRSYVSMKALGFQNDLLAPLVTFQVRGSVAASGGHDPEEILRKTMTQWGLRAEYDFNTSDVIVAEESAVKKKKSKVKTRAYDFVLPYKVPSLPWSLFIQCQFYAGDSGSVSHKNVDQTRSSRDTVKKRFGDARFVEYVDGAGYFSSLNGDLRSLMSMPDTASFFQIRSAPVRLRRELQSIGLVTALDVAHCALVTSGDREKIGHHLESEGYSAPMIMAAVEHAVKMGCLKEQRNNRMSVGAEWYDFVRRMFLVDVAVREGETVQPQSGHAKGMLLVPGYGPFYGVKIDTLIKYAMSSASELKTVWGDAPELPLADLRWLDESGIGLLT